MNPSRRHFTLGAAALFGTPAFAQLSGQPIRLILGFAAGTGPDVISRIIADHMGRQLGQPMVIDNKPGGEGIIAAQAAATAPADGSVIYFGSGHSLIGTPILRGRTAAPYDPFKDFTPIAQMGLYTLALVVAPGLPVKNLAEFVAYARARPGQLNFATSSINNRMASLQLVSQYKLDMTHVPYKSESLALTDLMANRVQMQVASVAVGLPAFAKDGRVKVLMVQRATRSPLLPEVPTEKEAGAVIKISPWSGLFGPGNMPAAIAERYSQAYRAAVSSKEVRDRFEQLGFEPVPTTPQELATIHRTEYEVFRKAVQEEGIKFD